jgi:hypothetical protein
MLVASGGVLIFRKDFIAIYLIYVVNSRHFGPPNNARYQMGGDIITQSTEEKDHGITIDEKLKFQIYIINQTKKANQRLGMIKRSFTYI